MYKEKSWVVLFGGAGRERVFEALLSNKIEIARVFVPSKQSSKLAASILNVEKFNLPVEVVDRSTLDEVLEPFANTVLLSVGFPYILPKSVFSRHALALNIHPTLLPKYRGPTTAAYILINNERYTGATVHLIEEKVDRGAIIAQRKIAVDPFDTIRSLQRKVYALEPALISEAISRLESGIRPIEQDETLASEYPRLRKPDDSLLDASRPLISLIDEIRACDPDDFPAYFFYQGQRLCVRLWRPDRSKSENDML
jgi:methionyl-tRNA formyltransferase